MMKGFSSPLLNKIAPAQTKGKQSLTITRKSLNSKPYADSLFHEINDRLLDVNHWQRYAGPATAHFQLTDDSGMEVHRQAQKGDYFRIDIPGPGSSAGKGDDWVRVQRIGREQSGSEEIAYMIVKPATNPLVLQNDTAHFFDRGAVSTFFVHKIDLTLTVGVLGRNEQANTHTSSLADRIRNFIIAIGAMLGLSSAQWKALTTGLLNHSLRSHV